MKSEPIWSIFLLVGLLVTRRRPDRRRPGHRSRSAKRSLKIAITGPIQDPTNMNMTYWSASRSTPVCTSRLRVLLLQQPADRRVHPLAGGELRVQRRLHRLTVKLRDGVTWSDGEPFTADDVVFTYDMLRENPTMAWATEASAAVTSVEKVDDPSPSPST